MIRAKTRTSHRWEKNDHVVELRIPALVIAELVGRVACRNGRIVSQLRCHGAQPRPFRRLRDEHHLDRLTPQFLALAIHDHDLERVLLERPGMGTEIQLGQGLGPSRERRSHACLLCGRRCVPCGHWGAATSAHAAQRRHRDCRSLATGEQQPTVRNEDRPQVHRVDHPVGPRDRLRLERWRLHFGTCDLRRRGPARSFDRQHHLGWPIRQRDPSVG